MGERCGIAFLQWVTGRKFLNKYERRKCRMKKGKIEWGKCFERKRKDQGRNAWVALVRFSRLGQMNHKDPENPQTRRNFLYTLLFSVFHRLFMWSLNFRAHTHTKTAQKDFKTNNEPLWTLHRFFLGETSFTSLNADQFIQVFNLFSKTKQKVAIRESANLW